MNTIVLWVLVSVGYSYRPDVVIERFTTQAHCEQANKDINSYGKCVRMEVYKP